MSNYDWETMALILVRILTTKPLSEVYKSAGKGGRGRQEQGWGGGPTCII
jgi:hypothetical protein